MTIRTLAPIAVVCAGCFHPLYDHPACGPGGACPSGLLCVNDVCESSGSGGGGPDGGPGSDGGTGGCTSFATLVNTCQLSFDADLILTGPASYDTDAHVLMIGGTAMPVAQKTVLIGADPVDVLSAHDVHLGVSAHLRATGSHGLAIIANHDIVMDTDAQIDVSNGGAGARTSCPNGATRGQDNAVGASGGGGGGFGADGGHGGDGKNGASQGGSRGQAEPSFSTGFHGGCPGADGGTGADPGGTGGKGGGALYIVAAGRIVLNSTAPLNAGGSGGQGGLGVGGGKAGGGGGGSGGLLILEAPHILGSTATIAANGGAGGEGSGFTGGAGASGANASVTTARAVGGAGKSTTGSDGGDGGSALGTAGLSVTASADGGGGGGGGGTGFIRIRSPDATFFAISPTPG